MARVEDYIREIQNSYKVEQVHSWYNMATSDEELKPSDITELASIANAAIERIKVKGRLNEETSAGSTSAKAHPVTTDEAYPVPVEEKKGEPRVESELFLDYRKSLNEAKTEKEVDVIMDGVFDEPISKLNQIDRMWLRKDRQQALNRVEGKIKPYNPFVRAGLDLMAVQDRVDLVNFTEDNIKGNKRDLNSGQREVLRQVAEEIKVIEGWD